MFRKSETRNRRQENEDREKRRDEVFLRRFSDAMRSPRRFL